MACGGRSHEAANLAARVRTTLMKEVPPSVPTPGEHLEPQLVAAYVDRALARPEREAAEAHLAACPDCQDEVLAVVEIVRARTRRRRLMLALPVAAAAALLFAFLPPRMPEPPPAGPGQHRDVSVTAGTAPELIGPRGDVTQIPTLRWRGFSGADRYEVTLFDDGGRVRWRIETGDTAAVIPDSVVIDAGAAYFWQVRARTDVGRWVSSPLADFRV